MKRKTAFMAASMLTLALLASSCTVGVTVLMTPSIPPLTTTTIAVSPTSITVGSVQGLTLTLSLDNTSFQPGQGVTVTLDERNTLLIKNIVATPELRGIPWGTSGAAAAYGPLGIALYQGNYVPGASQSTAMQLSLYNPNAIYLGPIPDMVNSYRFSPSSDMAVTVFENHILAANSSTLTELMASPDAYPVRLQYTIQQYWQGGEAEGLTPGVYTVVAQDEWGATAVLNFTVGS